MRVTDDPELELELAAWESFGDLCDPDDLWGDARGPLESLSDTPATSTSA